MTRLWDLLRLLHRDRGERHLLDGMVGVMVVVMVVVVVLMVVVRLVLKWVGTSPCSGDRGGRGVKVWHLPRCTIGRQLYRHRGRIGDDWRRNRAHLRLL